MVSTDDTRSLFGNNVVSFLREHGFDGLDLDWDHPATTDSSSADREKFVKLVSELQESFKTEAEVTSREKLVLTAAVPAPLLIHDPTSYVQKLAS